MPPVPFSAYTDKQLWNAQLALALACGRSHQTTRKKRNQWYCFLFQSLVVESDLRGLPHPQPPFHAGDLEPGAL